MEISGESSPKSPPPMRTHLGLERFEASSKAALSWGGGMNGARGQMQRQGRWDRGRGID